ncbi:hypothetical protein BC940DRAFT_364207 [Gongronella butleri]|nr:hypothetical protein BC940DRAFT_364207 [Gongronella butleri]
MNPSRNIVVPSQALSAIPIVAPPAADSPASTPTSPTKTTKPIVKQPSTTTPKRLCRNVIIHGFCKYEGKGCEFNHDANKPTAIEPKATTSIRIATPPTRANTFPNSASSSVTAESVNAPVFIPKSMSENAVPQRSATPSATSSPAPGDDHAAHDINALNNNFSQFDLMANSPAAAVHHHHAVAAAAAAAGMPPPPPPPPSFQHPMDMMNMMPPGPVDPYFYMHAGFPRQPLQYHLYSSATSDLANVHPHQRAIQSFFIPDNLREQLTRRNEAMLATASGHDLPPEVHVYHSLVALEDKPGQCFGHPSWLYKAMSSVDGNIYALVRIEGFRLVNELAMSVVESWRHIRHCNIVSIREAFTTRAFGDSSLIFVYDFHPCAMTLYQAHLSPQAQAAYGQNMMLPETTLWSYITQIASALKAVHGSGLAARNIEPSKILVTGKHRLRLNCASILDVIQYDGGQQVARYQQEDLLSFGKLIIALACNSLQSFHNLPQSIEYISRYYSPDVKSLILFLLSKPLPTKSIDDVISLIGARSLHEINCSQLYTDALEHELSKELENGRVVRLLCKLGFINERPEFDMDPRWSETGDRYIIKLFRDYVFHQVDDSGVPVVDMAHVLSCLNKLDAGVDEKIMLMSRDEQSCLIVSYKEIKNCIAAAFNDISSGRK